MKRVTGIGGVFTKARDKKALIEWYKRHLGVDVQDWGGTMFWWDAPEEQNRQRGTAWSLFEETSKYFGAGEQRCMINYRVANLRELLEALRAEGCAVDEKVEESEYGKFGWVTDPEGNRVELWEPPAGK